MASVDDLVASFNANHIGQEAMELAALQVRPGPPHFPIQAIHKGNRRRNSSKPFSLNNCPLTSLMEPREAVP